MLIWLTRRPLPYIVAASMLTIAAVLAWAGFSHDHERAERHQRDTAAQGARSVETLVGGLEYRVSSLRGLFAASTTVTDREFHVFARPLLSDHRASALGWLTLVTEAERAAFERRSGMRIRWMDGQRLGPAPSRPRYAVVTHLEPVLARAGVGFDAESLPGQSAVLERAAATGRTEASPPIVVPGTGEAGLVLYAPAYREGARLDNTDERRNALIGFGVGVFRLADLRTALARALPAGTAMRITTGGEEVVGVGHVGDSAQTRRLEVAGRDWLVAVQAQSRGGIGLGWLAVIVGVLVTVLLTLFTRQAVRAEASARELAELRRSERDAIDSANQTMLEHLEDVFVIRYDRDLHVVRASGALMQAGGVQLSDIEGRAAYELAPVHGHFDEVHEALQAALQGHHVSFDVEDSEHSRVLWMQALPLEDGDGGVMLVALDVTARADAERARRSAEERFRRSFEDAPVGMALLDGAGRYLEANEALGEILGRDPVQLAGRALAQDTHPDDASGEGGLLQDLLGGHTMRCSYEKRATHAAGHSLWVAVHATEIGAAGGAERVFLVQVIDITDQRRFEEQLQHLADHDPLTGLENRRAFERSVDGHLAHVKRYGEEGALLVLDLDHFKAVNDTLGHHAGDALIMAVGEVLRDEVRESDRVARLGGDEFAVLLPKADEEQAVAVAAKLVAAIRDERRILGGRSWTTTVSVGVALFSAATGRGEQLLVDADLAMYDAKEAGRDGFAVYRAGDHASSRTRARLAWMDRIRGALDEDRFTFVAQPILDLATDRVVHHELLLRMVDPDGDLIPPGSFLSIAERFGLVAELDTWVVRRAIHTLAEHDGCDLVLEVNLSGSSIGSPELLETIESELAGAGVDPRSLIFEITETAAVSNIPRARAFADRLAALGCRFALDDFGAGFGSFYYLKHLPFDFLKIDGEFVRHCAASSVDRVIISSLVRVANGLGKRTIAEYVDDQSTIETLRALGVDMAQGYSIGKPEPLEHWLRAAAPNARAQR